MNAKRTWYPLSGATGRSLLRTSGKPGSTKAPVDPRNGPKIALAGKVVTMDRRYTVRDDAVVYIADGVIVAIRPRTKPAPKGFEAVAVHETRGTIFPGLIELHNHLSYNALPLWSPVPKRYDNRGQWPNHADYRKLVSGPMTVIGKYRDAQGNYPLLPALIRYVECKCLLGGVTTSQGVMLFSNAGVKRFYQGLVRNVEQTDDPDLPEAQGRIPDLEAKDAAKFLARLNKEDSCFLLHLSEGVSGPGTTVSTARKHFLALEVGPGKWALNDKFTGIHAAGLLAEDFGVLRRSGSSIVWSPMSNLLLYGDTARVEAAKQAGVLIGLGSDWSVTGSKNLLGEMKVAWLYNLHNLGSLFKPREIVAMATRNAARILKWDQALGTLKAGARADLLVIDGQAKDPYMALLRAAETDIRLVMINGVARYGWPGLMGTLVPADQTVNVGGKSRRLYLKQETSDPDVAQVPLKTAVAKLRAALKGIAAFAAEMERPQRSSARRSAALDAQAPPQWALALDEIQVAGVQFAPRLPFSGPTDTTGPERAPRAPSAASPPLSTLLHPVHLDPLTVADDPGFLTKIEQQPNVPDPIRKGLRGLY